jgi:hypothetical protein
MSLVPVDLIMSVVFWADFMATIRSDRTAIYSGAVVQGAVAVVFFAFAGVLIDRYHLTLPQYGILFIPLFLAIVVTVLFSASLCYRIPVLGTYRSGLAISLAGMAALVATEWQQRLPVTYPLLLAAAVFVGAGFGLAYPHVRCYAVCFKPLRSRRQSILVNALLTVGMAAAPAYQLGIRGTSAWWTLPVLLGFLLIAEMLLTRSLRAPPDGAPMRLAGRPVPTRFFRAYPALALLYGICAIICLTAYLHPPGSAPLVHLNILVLAEVGFWAALINGARVAFAIIDGMSARRHAASMGVFTIAIVVLILSAVFTRYALMHIALYLLAGISCAALLPIDTRPGNEHISLFPHAIAGGIMALFPVGLGLSRYLYDIFAAIGVSPFAVFIGLAVVGVLVCILLLPIMLSWSTMGYFEQPAWRNADLSAIGSHGDVAAPRPLAAPPPRRPCDHGEDDSGRQEQHGATALHRGPQRGSPRQGGWHQ